jgi:hypothetical protein
MEIKINIPDAQKDRIIQAFCSQYGYDPYLYGNPSLPNPETRPQFAKRMLAQVIKDTVRTWEANEAQRIAREASIIETDKLIIT